WQRADQHFQAAKRLCDEAAGDAAVVRRALAARDRAYSALPWYSRWLARSADERQKEQGELFNLVIDLWDDVHDLDRRLRPEKPDADTIDKGNDSLKALGGRVSAGLHHVEDAFRRHCDGLPDLASRPDNWQKID